MSDVAQTVSQLDAASSSLWPLWSQIDWDSDSSAVDRARAGVALAPDTPDPTPALGRVGCGPPSSVLGAAVRQSRKPKSATGGAKKSSGSARQGQAPRRQGQAYQASRADRPSGKAVKCKRTKHKPTKQSKFESSRFDSAVDELQLRVRHLSSRLDSAVGVSRSPTRPRRSVTPPPAVPRRSTSQSARSKSASPARSVPSGNWHRRPASTSRSRRAQAHGSDPRG
jgi:hypothetical protein